MPLGFERLNERSQRPNANINFIKPLTNTSPQDQKIAKDFLERIAAQCYPVMKKHYISVMALEEFPPNSEFLGRNFNAGECIQLVLKDRSGRWFPFAAVQMVMMHELAHCKHMNHSRFFWNVRNEYAQQMEELWGKGYVGEGLWGRGKALADGAFAHDRMPQGPDAPQHLCGGTYRRARGRKRKRGEGAGTAADKPKVSYAERQQKRIAKKFGVHGDGKGLGEDELVRGALEQGKRHAGKPKVAGSKRGRELRANAALLRFEAAKFQQQREKEATPDLDGSETGSDDEWDNGLPILNQLESSLKDDDGEDLFKVCGEEHEDEEGGEEEAAMFRQMGAKQATESKTPQPRKRASQKRAVTDSEIESEAESHTIDEALPRKALAARGQTDETVAHTHEDSETDSEAEVIDPLSKSTETLSQSTETLAKPQPPTPDHDSNTMTPAEPPTSAQQPVPPDDGCPVCSLVNDPSSSTCLACAHVLKSKLVPNAWRCKSEACKESKYVNAGDAGRCGVCGAQKPAAMSKASTEGRSGVGVISGDVLRWD